MVPNSLPQPAVILTAAAHTTARKYRQSAAALSPFQQYRGRGVVPSSSKPIQSHLLAHPSFRVSLKLYGNLKKKCPLCGSSTAREDQLLGVLVITGFNGLTPTARGLSDTWVPEDFLRRGSWGLSPPGAGGTGDPRFYI